MEHGEAEDKGGDYQTVTSRRRRGGRSSAGGVASAATPFSKMSVNRADHAAERAQERAITEDDRKRAKRQDEDNGGVVLDDDVNVEREDCIDDGEDEDNGDGDDDGLAIMTAAAFAKQSSTWVGGIRSAGVSQQRDDDEMSRTSTCSRHSTVSYKPTKHSWEQAKKRGITKDDIQRAKAAGKMSLSIRLNGEEDTTEVKEEIRWWGDRLKEAFEQLEVGEVIEKGKPKDRRVQMELDGSEKMGQQRKEWMDGHTIFDMKDWLQKHDYFREKKQQSTDVKEWLTEHGYSWQERQRRVLFKLRQGLVVVEGHSAPDEVGVITNYRRNEAGIISKDGYQFDTREFAIDFYSMVYSALLLDLDADEDALDHALTRKGRVRVDAASRVWVIGPGSNYYSLSTWPPDNPFLMHAARLGRANIVEHLVTHYKCDVNYQTKCTGQKIGKQKGVQEQTALHQAAYYGHADVVSTLLRLDTNHTIQNKYGETAIDCAKAGQEAYGKATDKTAFFPETADVDQLQEKGYQKGVLGAFYTPGTRVDFTTRDGWPGWVEIIRMLESASVDKTQ